ncbi:MAG: T9SS type A sorting domain-containing protein [Bacteroidia bacterium]
MRVVLFAIFFHLSLFCCAQTWPWAKASAGDPGGSGNKGYAVCTDAGNNAFITGSYSGNFISFGSYTLTNTGMNSGVFVVKYDPAGNVLWAKSSKGFKGTGYGICTDNSGNVFVTGSFKNPSISFGAYTLTTSNASDVFLVKYDANGNELWAKSGILASGGNAQGTGVCADINGNVCITGVFVNASITFGSVVLSPTVSPYNDNSFITKYDANGNVIWAKSNSGSAFGGITSDNANNIYVAGGYDTLMSAGTYTLGASGLTDIFLAKYDVNGNVIWLKGAGGTNDDIAFGVSADACGKAYITGVFNSANMAFGSSSVSNVNPGTTDVFVAKYDVNGNALWSKSINGTSDDYGYSVSAGNDCIYVGGSPGSLLSIGSVTLAIPSGTSNPVFITKFDMNGNLLCASAAGSGGDDQFRICATPSGDAYLCSDFTLSPYVIGTTTLTPAVVKDVYVAKYACTASGGACTVTNVKALRETAEAAIYPNPNNGTFTVKTEIDNCRLIIYDSAGQKTDERNLSPGENTVHLNNIASGLYHYIILKGDEQTGAGKMAIE